MITPPFTRAQFLGALDAAFSRPENVTQEREKPRASALAGCARENAYMMAGTEASDAAKDDLDKADSILTAEQGRMMEDLSIAVIEQLGLTITGRQTCIGHVKCSDKHEQGPEDFFVTGHPDGGFLGEIDGLRWGMEHKHFGRWSYEATFKYGGIMEGDPAKLCQTLLYGTALGWDAVQYVVIAQDASSTRSDARSNLRAKNPERRWAVDAGWNPKVYLESIDLRPLKGTLLPLLAARAYKLSQLREAGVSPAEVVREYEPEELTKTIYAAVDGEVVQFKGPEFPCSHCAWYTQCVRDGQGSVTVPALPFKV